MRKQQVSKDSDTRQLRNTIRLCVICDRSDKHHAKAGDTLGDTESKSHFETDLTMDDLTEHACFSAERYRSTVFNLLSEKSFAARAGG